MTYSPDTGLVYIPALDIPFSFAQDNAFQYNPKTWNTGVDFGQTDPSLQPRGHGGSAATGERTS